MRIAPHRLLGWAALALAACGDGSSSTGGTGAGGSGGSASASSTAGSGGAASSSNASSSDASSSVASSSAASSSSGSMNTPCAGPQCDVTVYGTAFGEHDGKTVYIGFVPQGGMKFDAETSAVVQGGTFTVSLPQALDKGKQYFMNYYADVNDNQSCEPGTDHIWRTSLPAVAENLVINVVHDLNFSNLGCGGF